VSEVSTHPVNANGPDTLLRVSENVKNLLVDIQKEQEIVTLWVDAICINQADVREREEQIKIMALIYSRAKQVIVWLGRNNAAHSIFATIRQVSQLRDRAPKARQCHERLEDVDKVEHSIQPWQWLEFRIILQHPWFDRTWTVQEIVLARSASVHASHEQLAWSDLTDACWVARLLGQFDVDRLARSVMSREHLRHYLRIANNGPKTSVQEGTCEGKRVMCTIDLESSAMMALNL
jgi:hypothetical protein